MDVAEGDLKKSEEEQSKLLDRLDDLRATIKRQRRQVEFAKKRAEEQFWCLERELEESDQPNLYAQVREATDLEKELYGDLIVPSPQAPPRREASSQSS